jgi:hypothetical protein
MRTLRLSHEHGDFVTLNVDLKCPSPPLDLHRKRGKAKDYLLINPKNSFRAFALWWKKIWGY